VAFATGYNSLSAFNAAFREFTGQTPSDYRAGVGAAAMPA
jgi:AraC-like DNA-binding protein